MPLYFLTAESVFVCGAVGYAISQAVKLMRPLDLEKKKLLPALIFYGDMAIFLQYGLQKLTIGSIIANRRKQAKGGSQ